MDFLSLFYFLELTKDLHFTNTANRLFISQQTLSNTIHRLENELDTILIERVSSQKKLTTSGELVKEFARKSLAMEENLKEMLKDIENEMKGDIHFGAPTVRMNTVIQEILPIFSKKFPLVTVHLYENITENLLSDMDNGKLDIALIISNHKSDSYQNNKKIFYDQVYYCISNSLLESHFGNKKDKIINESLSGVDFKKFVTVPTCILINQIGVILDNIFDELNIEPKKYTVSSSMQTSANIGLTGAAAFFATQSSLSLYSNTAVVQNDLVYVFPIYYNGEPLAQYISLINQKNQYQTKYLRYFKELLEEKLKSLEVK